MRIDKINLIAVGPFTGKSLDLSAGSSGLHLIYGDNEAGKSSTMRAIRAFFFDFPVRSTDNFVHEMGDMQVGLSLRDAAGITYDWVRSKKKKDPLKDAAGAAVAADALLKLTGSVGEEAFNNFFGINHDQLLAGGRLVLDGKGAIGEALSSAGLGGMRLKEVLKRLGERSEALFKPAGRNPPINRQLSEMDAANKDRERESLRANDWNQRRQDVAAAEARQKGAKADLLAAHEKRADGRRLLAAVPLLLKRATLRAKIDALGPLPTLPKDFGKRREEAATELAAATRAKATATDGLTKVTDELAALVVPTNLLAAAEAIERLNRGIDGYTKARDSLPKLRAERETSEADAGDLLRGLWPNLPVSDVQSKRMETVTRQNLLQLADDFSRLDERLKTAKAGRNQAAAKLAEWADEAAAPGALPDVRELRRRLDEIEARGLSEKESAAARAEVAAGEKRLRAVAHRLGVAPLPEQSWDKLAVPTDETVAAAEREFERATAETETAAADLKRHEEDVASNEENLLAIRRGGGVPTTADLSRLRKQRDQHWATLRDGRTGVDAAAYEAAVAAADQMVDDMRAHVDRVVKHEGYLALRERFGRTSERMGERAAAAARWQQEVAGRWAATWAATGVTPRPPVEMRGWLAEYRGLCESSQKLGAAVLRAAGLEIALAEGVEALRAVRTDAGTAVSPAASFAQELSLTRQLVDDLQERARDQKQRAETVKEARRQAARAESELGESTAAMAAWDTAWDAATAGLSESALHPATARHLIGQIDKLFETLKQVQQRKAKVVEAEAAAAAFEAEAAALAELFPAGEGATPGRVAAGLSDRLKQGRELLSQQKQAVKRQANYREEIDRAERDRNEAGQRQVALCEVAGCDQPADLQAVEERVAERRNLVTELGPVEENLSGLSAGRGIESLSAEVARVSLPQLEMEIAETESATRVLSARETECSEALGAERKTFELMDGSGKAAEAANRAQMLAAGVVEKASQYVRFRVAETLLRAAVKRYREKHQGSLVTRAGELFSRLTCSSFDGLTVAEGDDDDGKLCGLRGDRAVPVTGMSDGTRDALFLSLRLASLEEYLRDREPFPLLVDDVTINLDDRRSRAMLSVLAELSDKTQVIFFTHHARLIELAAEAAGPRLTVHRLHAAAGAIGPVTV